MTDVPSAAYPGDVKQDWQRVPLKLDGELFDEHTVPAEMFAESVLGLAKVYRRADKLLNDKPRNIKIEITAQRPGSFVADIIVQVPDLIDHAKALLTGKTVAAVLNAAGLISLVGSAIAAIKWLGNRAVSNVERMNTGFALIQTMDGDQYRVPDQVATLIEDPTFRKKLDEFTSPLEEEGVDSIQLGEGESQAKITRADRSSFEYVAPDDDIEVTEEELSIWPRGTLFDEGEKWPFDAVGHRFRATMRDQAFLHGVKHGSINIKAGDKLRVVLRTTRFPDSRRPIREVVEVLEHLESMEEQQLF